MSAEYRQEVLNVILAQLLQERGVVSVPEGIIKSIDDRRRMPDVMVDFIGLRMMIEGEVGDQQDAEEQALTSAQRRVEEGLAHIGLAVIYPEFLRSVPFEQLKDKLADSPLKVATTSEAGISGFTSGNVDHLIDMLHKTYEQLTEEDVVAQAVAIIDAAVEKAAGVLRYSPAFPEAAARILSIRELPVRKKKVEDHENDI
ncbi:MAG: hypothetical protein FJ121_12970 [Deltaproteobacteria bacterium]|nr:hypothetical protein [Deltaproteobacteria bacterium]